MTATVEGAFVLIDKASSTLKDIERQALKTQAAVEGVGAALDAHEAQAAKTQAAMEKGSKASDTFAQSLDRERQMARGATEDHKALTSAMRDTGKGFDDMGTRARKAESDLKSMRSESSQLRRELGVLGKAMAGAAIGSLFGPVGTAVGGVAAGAFGAAQNSTFGQVLQSKEGMKELKSAASDAKDAFGALGQGLQFLKIGSLVTAIQPAIGAIMALSGGVVAFLPRIAQLGQAFYALPAAVSAGAQAFGTFGMAMQGVMGAIQQAMTMQNQWSYNQQQWSEQVIDAQNAVVTSQNALTNAIWSQNQAQLQLTIARRDATRQLQDMEYQAKSAVLAETQSGLNVMQARQTLARDMATAGTSQLQISQDRLAVEQAILTAQHQQVTTQRASIDYARARRRDPTSQPTMQLAQAQHAAAQSVFETSQAEKALARSQYELNHLYQVGNAGVMGYMQALRGLQPAQRQFVQWLTGPLNGSNRNSLLNQFQQMQNAAGQGLFPGLEQGLSRFSRTFGVIDNVLTKTGRAIGGTLDRLLGRFADPHWLQSIGNSNARTISTLGDALVHLGGVFKDMISAAQPFMHWVATSIDQWAKYRDQVDGSGSGMKRLEGRFRTLERAIKDVFTWLHNLWITFRNIGEVADKALGGQMWKGAISGTANWAKWAEEQNKLGNKGSLFKWFHDMLPTLRAFKDFIEAIGKALVNLSGPGGQRGAQTLLGSLTQLLGPLTTVLRAMATDAPYFQRIALWLANIVASLAKIPGIGVAIGGLFAVAIVGRWVSKLAEGAKHLMNIANLMGRVSRTQKGLSGMASPGVTGGRSGWRTRLGAAFGMGGGGGLAGAIQASQTWGIRSEGGPGSYTNPLAVEVINGAPGSIGGASGSRAAEERAVVNAEETTAARARGRVSGLTNRLVDSKVPGTTALASGIDSVASKFGNVADKLKPVTDVLGKLAGPLVGSALAFGLQSGSVQRRGVAAAHALDPTGWLQGLAGLGSGLPGVGGAFNTLSHIPSVSQLVQNGIQGLMGTTYVLKGQALTAYRDVGRIGVPGLPAGVTPVGPNGRPVAAAASPVTGAGQDAQKWLYELWHDLASGEAPRDAVKQTAQGMLDELGKLSPSGRAEVQAALVDWGNTFVQNTPSMKQPVDNLLGYIMTSWGDTQTQIQQVNSQILGTSTQQWNQIYTSMTNPMIKAQDELAGVYGKIQQEAIGALMSMGLTRSDATMLLKHPASANQWMHWASGTAPASNYSTTGSGIGHRNATGGRVAGNNLRDVYAFGGNMLGGGELIVNRHQEQDANARLMRHGEPTIGTIVNNVQRPHWLARGGRATGGYVDPIPGFTLGRTDMGVDADARVGAPIYALGTSRMTALLNNWYQGQPLMDFQLLSGPDKGRYWYVAEQINPIAHVGQVIPQGSPVARFAAHGTGIEIGWAANAAGQTLAQATTGYTEGQQTAAGMSFRGIITGGAQSGYGTGVGYGIGKAKQIHLKVPQFGGIGGVPKVVASRAAGAYAASLQSGLNAGMGAAGSSGLLSGNFTGGGSAQQNEALGRRMMLAAGWGANQWPYLLQLWNKESGWSTTADNPSSGAYGIAQALPASKYATAGADWRTNPATQIKWGLGYIRQRYGSPQGAWGHETSFNWYDKGGRVRDAGWFGDGGTFVTSGPTVFGAGERGPEKVTVQPAGSTTGSRPIHIQIDKIEVHRPGDIRRIVDEEFAKVAEGLGGSA